ncbi:MAG: tyrosine-type recombinase/integrase [Gemmatimonadaceae bacterium]
MVVRWRGESDKEETEHWMSLTSTAITALTVARNRALAVGDTWIFPHSLHAGPRDRHAFSKWWLEAEQLAELDHDQWWGFHALRRQFASELKVEPISDIAARGGWKSTTTLLTCYIETDQGTMKRALDRRRMLSEERMESKHGEQHAQR